MEHLRVHTLRINGMCRPQYVRNDFQFSWVLERDTNGCTQHAYEVSIWHGGQQIWNSGMVFEARCFGVPYAGPALEPVELYQWRVTCWDTDGNHAEAWDTFRTCRGGVPWETGWVRPLQEATRLERPFPFGGRPVPQPRDYHEFQPTQLVRRSFTPVAAVRKAVVHVSAHGVYRLELNGSPVGTALLTPDCTPYDKLQFFQSYDVTDQLLEGENVIGVELADGWWIGRLGLGSWNCQYGDQKDLFLSCEVIYEDGRQVCFGGEAAKSAVGPARYADLFVGECFDASVVPAGWSKPGFDDHAWHPVKPLLYPLDTLCPQMGDEIRIVACQKPAAVRKTPDGDWVLDAGQNVAGFLRFTVATEAGREIVLEYSEMLQKDGCFFQNIMGTNKDQRDVYRTKDGLQTWQPRFTYHGFRYVRITGWPGIPMPEQFQICIISSETESIGDFSCSDERLNQLQRNIRWSQRANTVAIPTDCPQREKAGWTGDIAVYAPTMLYLAPAEAFLRRWLLYLRQEQFENGLVPSVVPYWGVYREISRLLGSDTSCGWGDAVLLVPWAIYCETGNDRVLRENYGAMTRWMAYVRRAAETGRPEGYDGFDEARKQRQKYLWNTGFHYGDWLLPSVMMAGGTPQETARLTREVFGSAYYVYANQVMKKISAALGKEREAQLYCAQYERIRQAFCAEYVQADGRILPEYQGNYVVALKFGLIPEPLRTAAVDRLCHMICQNGGCLDTGFLSVPFLLDVLCENDRRSLAYRLLFQTKCPSWLYMVAQGATTIWESWNCVSQDGTAGPYSYNHYAFGCIGAWLYREVAGLELLEPGYRRVRIRPGLESGLRWARTSHRTPYGQLEVCWKQDGRRLTVEVRIPTGVIAEIVLPDGTVVRQGSGQAQVCCTLPET